VTLTFMAKAPGQSSLTITRGGARDPAMQAITMSGAQAPSPCSKDRRDAADAYSKVGRKMPAIVNSFMTRSNYRRNAIFSVASAASR